MNTLNKEKFKFLSAIPSTGPEISIGNLTIPRDFLLIGGPCTVEGENFLTIGQKIKEIGAGALRANIFKPRTSPHDFQGLGKEGYQILKEARKEISLPMVSEVLDPRDVESLCQVTDILQIGSRSVQNFPLLKEVGKTEKPIILKRGMHSTINEWLSSAEYILKNGNSRVILCERGIRAFETMTRNTLDLSAIPIVKKLTNLPIIVDPSHSTGRADLVRSMSLAAIAAGADGLLIEVHTNPPESMVDKDQAITPEEFAAIEKLIVPLRRLVTLE